MKMLYPFIMCLVLFVPGVAHTTENEACLLSWSIRWFTGYVDSTDSFVLLSG
jgi:hypothetical protein